MNRQQEKITALYCRIDGGKQTEPFAQYQQMQVLIDYARKHELSNPCFFCDWSFSGTMADRPEYRRMLRMIDGGEAANLVITDLGRLIRGSVLDCGRAVKALLDSGVTLHLTTDGADAAKQAVALASAIDAAYRERGEA